LYTKNNYKIAYSSVFLNYFQLGLTC